MVRFQALILGGVAALAVASFFFQGTIQEGGDHRFAKEAELWFKQHLEFMERMKSFSQKLESGSASLRDVAAQTRDYCEVFYPSYLKSVNLLFEGDTEEERIARNFLACYEVEVNARPHCAQTRALAQRLREEIKNWNEPASAHGRLTQ